MIAPTTQSGAISSSEPSSMKRGWMREPGRGAVVVLLQIAHCAHPACPPPRSLHGRWRSPPRSAEAGYSIIPHALDSAPAGSVQPVVTRRGFRRHDALRHILFHQRGRARTRIAEAGAARQSHLDDLVGACQRDQLAGAAIVHHVAVRIEHHAAHAPSRQPAMQSLHRDADAFRIHRCQCRQPIVVQFAQPRAHAATAAMLARATGIGDEGFLDHQHRRARLHQLDRGVGGRCRIQQRRLAVAVFRGALPRTHEEMVGIDVAALPCGRRC